ncbi:MAG: hypothetical protein UX21_C0005G0003 [Microgenomates group bacterium GW2011_GWC2_45_8]|nr:MAG: hypothetical protein UX21_C0005G0003 [Microgenomates group bacterium GW2011_GWC2_45_8]
MESVFDFTIIFLLLDCGSGEGAIRSGNYAGRALRLFGAGTSFTAHGSCGEEVGNR